MNKYSNKPKTFYFEPDNNFGRKTIIWNNNGVSAEIGYHYENGNVEAYDGKIIDSVTHPFKAARILKEYWTATESERQKKAAEKLAVENKEWLLKPLIAKMKEDYERKFGKFSIEEFKKWYRRNLYDYEDMYPDLVD